MFLRHSFFWIYCLLLSLSANAIEPINYNANTHSTIYSGTFRYGSNTGNPAIPVWDDYDTANLILGNVELNILGTGSNSLRPGLPERFLEKYGYDMNVPKHAYYSKLGAKDNVLFIGYPSDAHREEKSYLCMDANGEFFSYESQVFKNLYEPIWIDDGAGKKINPDNYYAMYVDKLVEKYGDTIKFWEVWNEPDYTTTGKGDAASGIPENWWENDPSPCHLKGLRDTVQSYIRMLRITYEVVKAHKPNDLVCLGGIGYASFLDAVLRNTDHPDDGKITVAHPLKGGAWFDCVSYHDYPMYYLKKWGNGGFIYSRNSDTAVRVVLQRQRELQQILQNYGYDGTLYPQKEFLITETNIPRKDNSNPPLIHSAEAQVNYNLKVAIKAQEKNIRGIYIYGTYDNKKDTESGSPFDYMGFYKLPPQKPSSNPYQAVQANDLATGWRTLSTQLQSYSYSWEETQRLNLPDTIDGVAFHSNVIDQKPVYVLWASTEALDLSEQVSVNYTFPAAWGVEELSVTHWDAQQQTHASDTLALSGSPVWVQVTQATRIKELRKIQTGTDAQLTKKLSEEKLQLIPKMIPVDHELKVTYQSDQPEIASIDQTGLITFHQKGAVNFTLHVEETMTHQEAFAKLQLTIVDDISKKTEDKLIKNITLETNKMELTESSEDLGRKQYFSVGAITITPAPAQAEHPKLSFVSNNTTAVRVDNDSQQLIINDWTMEPGEALIRITAEETENYQATTIELRVIVNALEKEEKQITVLQDITKKPTDEAWIITPEITPKQAARERTKIIYTSSHPEVATFEPYDFAGYSAKVKQLANGVTRLTITSTEGAKYKEASRSFVLTVSDGKAELVPLLNSRYLFVLALCLIGMVWCWGRPSKIKIRRVNH